MNVRSLLTAAFAAGAVALAGAQQPALKSGLDPANFDKSVRPQDDLFRYVNGTWLAKTPIPADRAVYGTFVPANGVLFINNRSQLFALANK